MKKRGRVNMPTFLLMSAHKWEPPSPPAALDYVAWELEKASISSEIVDYSFITNTQLESLLEKTQYDGVCMTIRNLERTAFSQSLHFPLPSIKTLVQLVKKYCKGPLIVGGNGFSIAPEQVLEYIGADYGLCGGAEASLPLLVSYIFDHQGDITKIPGLVYWENNHIRCNSAPPHQRDLPPVKRGYIDYKKYFRPGYENFSRFGNIETKRGCPYHCTYCVEPCIKGCKVRVKPPEVVTREVDWFLDRGITYLFMTDSEFNNDVEAACTLMRYWKRKGYHRKMKWLTYATPSDFTEEFAQLLSESGNLCTAIDFAHVSSNILSNLKKTYTSADIEHTISVCEKFGVSFRGSLMLGGPGETRETIREAVTFFKGIDCEISLVLGIRVFPNTPLGKFIKKSGPLVDNPNLYGKVLDNDDLLEPVYYISHEIGKDIFSYLEKVIPDPQQFYLLTSPFKLSCELVGHFRGVTPGYKTEGALKMQYVTGDSDEKWSHIS